MAMREISQLRVSKKITGLILHLVFGASLNAVQSQVSVNPEILNVALLRLRFCSITASKPAPNLSVISARLSPYKP